MRKENNKVIEANALTKRFGNVSAVNQVTFSVNERITSGKNSTSDISRALYENVDLGHQNNEI